ncbi:MAG: hypothetical protein ACRD7E_08745 [Bryobacteraceae bacterium]
MFSRRHLKLLLPFWILAIIIGSFLPAETKQTIGTQSGMEHGWSHRAYHLGAFGLTALLVSLVNRKPSRQVLWCGAVFLLGLSIELTQSAISRLPVEWGDVRDDAIGIIALMLVAQFKRVRNVLVSQESHVPLHRSHGNIATGRDSL